MSIILAILVFGLIVLIHEFGHFIVAKRCGVCVLEFSIGMGPTIYSFTKGETNYCLKAIPFGGYCMMLDENGEEGGDNPGSFQKKSVWVRIAVIFAGPLFNFLLALVLAVGIVWAIGFDSPQLIAVSEGFPAAEQGMQEGDIITKLNNDRVVVYRDITLYMLTHGTETVTVEYKRPAADGTMEKRTAVLTPQYSEETGRYMLGIVVNGYRQPAKGIGEILKYGSYEVLYWVKNTVASLRMIVAGQVQAQDFAGPVRMVSIIDETVEESMDYGWDTVLLNLANMCVLLSVNLGIMNLLPIPALDGGRLLFLFVEVIRRKPADAEVEGRIHMIGMAFLMVLMVFIFFNDIVILFFQ